MTSPTLENLPIELWTLIGPDLSVCDVVSLSMVSKRCHQIAHTIDDCESLHLVEDVTLEPNPCQWRNLRDLLGLKLQQESIPKLATQMLFSDNLTYLKILHVEGPAKNHTDGLMEAVRSLKHVTDLRLAEIPLRDDGARKIARLLESHKFVRLALPRNKITCVGVEVLCEKLKDNKTVRFLDLSENDLGEAGEFSIARALEANTPITTVWTSTAQNCWTCSHQRSSPQTQNSEFTKVVSLPLPGENSSKTKNHHHVNFAPLPATPSFPSAIN